MIFFDIDNTLIDYNVSEKKAITKLILTNCNYKITKRTDGISGLKKWQYMRLILHILPF